MSDIKNDLPDNSAVFGIKHDTVDSVLHLEEQNPRKPLQPIDPEIPVGRVVSSAPRQKLYRKTDANPFVASLVLIAVGWGDSSARFVSDLWVHNVAGAFNSGALSVLLAIAGFMILSVSSRAG